MKLKSAFAAIAATTALTGAVFLTETAHAKPCFFQSGTPETTSSSDPAIDPTTTQANLNNFSKLGIVGASFAVLGGLLGGGVILKRQFDRKAEPQVEAPQAEASVSELPEPAIAPAPFAIKIPQEVLRDIRASEQSDVTSTK